MFRLQSDKSDKKLCPGVSKLRTLFRFLLLWPWSRFHDLETWTCFRHSEAVPPRQTKLSGSVYSNVRAWKLKNKTALMVNVNVEYNQLGNLNSGRRPWAKLIRSASLQRVFDAASAKLLCRLVCRCFCMSICVWTTLNGGECVVFRQNRRQMATRKCLNCYVCCL